MEFKLLNLLEMSLEGEDINNFAIIFGQIKKELDEQGKKAGFKGKNPTVKLELDEELVVFVESVCNQLNISHVNEDEQTENS